MDLFSKRKLVPWLRLILRNQTVLETMYQPWSYAVTTGEPRIIPSVVIFTHFIVITGFDDTFKLLERLSLYVFDLPVDVAVNQFQQIDEAF